MAGKFTTDTKSPTDVEDFSIDFTGWVNADDTILTANVVAYLYDTANAVAIPGPCDLAILGWQLYPSTPSASNSYANVENAVVTTMVAAGGLGNTYVIAATVNTANGEQGTRSATLQIKAL